MEERRLGPVVGLGTWNTFRDDTTLAKAVVEAALAAGIRLFDTSPMYASERALGAALAGRGTVATKIWARTRDEAEQQLRDQRTWFPTIHIEQIHNLVAWREQLEWLEQEESIDLLGVTHYSPSAFGELALALRTKRFDVVQLPYNPHERECERELLPLAAELDVRVIVMRPLASGALVQRRVDPGALRELGVETWAQALLKWALSDERVDVVIPATSKPERCDENAAAGEPPFLTPEQRALVEELCS
jgi:diketogulonate reductase-like aldo/keto reductase